MIPSPQVTRIPIRNFSEGEDEEDESFEEDGEECDLPGVAHSEDYGVGEVSVESHSRSEEEGEVCAEGHDDCSGESRECGCDEDAALVHAGYAEDGGVDCEDVRHCEECR